jgi:hypothetical protein
MSAYKVPRINWSDHLARILVHCEPGDTIIVDTETKRKLGEIAAERMGKDVTMKVAYDV